MASKTYKTYSKSYAKETAASRAFDEVISNKASQQIPIKAEKTKWGDTSFTRVREDDPFEVTYKKVKVENETVDPFTFDLEEDGSPRKKKPVNNTACQSLGSGGLGRPAIPNVKVYQKSAVPEKTDKKDNVKNEEEGDTETVLFKRPVKTYSRAGRKEVNQDENRSSSSDQSSKSYLSAEDTVQETDGDGGQTSRRYEDDNGQKEDDDVSARDESVDNNEDDDEDDMGTFNKGSAKSYGGKGGRGAQSTQRITPKTHILQSDDDDISGGATVLNFRSHYMDPAVYGQFKYIPQEEDPVGRLKNSKVLQQSEIKHGKGSTLIVICSPKPPADGCKTLHPVKTYKVRPTNVEDDNDSDKNDSEEIPKVEPRRTRGTRDPQLSRAAKRQAMERIDDSEMRMDTTESNIYQEENPLPVPEESSTIKKNTRNSESKPRYNRIFRSRNKGLPAEAKKGEENNGNISKQQAELPPDLEASKENTNSGQVLVQDIIESEDNVETAPPAKKKLRKEAESAFGFDEDEEMKDEASEEIVEDSQKENSEVSQEQENSKSEQEKAPLEEEPKVLSKREKRIKNKQISLLKEKELEGDSQSSDGEFDSSQDIASDSQTSEMSGKESNVPPRERKIFKSKNSKTDSAQRKIFQSPKKSPAKAVYNVRPWHDDFDEEDRSKSKGGETKASDTGNGSEPPKLKPISKIVPKFDEKDPPPLEPPKLTRAVHWPDRMGDEAYTSVHVTKEHKQLYTVVKNVKQAHECQEYGETQEFSDDVEYLLSGVQEGEPMSTRCLSCIGLAQKCILPAFRMHLRAHGTVAKIFGHLSDAVSDPSLALCTALLMFMLSRDRLNMDLDRQSLDLMLKLLGVDNQEEQNVTVMGKRALNRNKDRAKAVYEQWKVQGGGANQPELEDISTGNLAMESLLSLTSRRAGEWFKEELRTLGALDHIVDTVCSCIEALGDDTTLLTDSAVENLKKIDRCLRVLENVSFVNTENQTFLISYKSGVLITSLCRSLATCEKCFPVYPVPYSGKLDKESTGYVIYSCVLAILRVLLNLTHDNEYGCTKVGEQMDFISTVLTCILQTPQYVPVDFRFDILVLSLGLLINMVEHCGVNRRRLIDAKTIPSYDETSPSSMPVPATKALVQVFCRRFEIAKQMEEQDFDGATTPQTSPNKSGEWKESDSGIEWVMSSGSKKDKDTKEDEEEEPQNRLKPPDDEFGNSNIDDEETFSRALHKAGKHMENSIVASYIALLLGCLIQDNTIFVSQVKEHLPNENFEDMIVILKKFLGFMNLTTAVGSTGGKSIAHVIEVLEGC